jgi:hypothetical protein
MRQRWRVRTEQCALWLVRTRDRLVRLWYAPWMVRWGRLGALVIAGTGTGVIYHLTAVDFDGPMLVLVVLSWVLSVAASVYTTKAYSGRSLGMIGTIMGDIFVWTTFALVAYHVAHLSQRMLDYGRGYFTVGAPVLAVGVVRSMLDERKRDRAREQSERSRTSGEIVRRAHVGYHAHVTGVTTWRTKGR